MKNRNRRLAVFLAAAMCVASAGSAALTDNLAHYYTLDESSHQNGWVPSAGKLVLGGLAESFVDGKVGQGMGPGSSFAGTTPMTDEYFQPGTGDWTLAIWVKQAALSAPRTILKRGVGKTAADVGAGGYHAGWHLSRNPNGTLALAYGYSNRKWLATSTAILPDETWGYLTIRRRGTSLQLLLNGETVIRAVLGDPFANIAPSTDTWYREFASGPQDDIRLREGDAMDELAVWTRALADAELAWLYNNGSGRPVLTLDSTFAFGLQQYYPLDANFEAAAGAGDASSLGGSSAANFADPGKFGAALSGTTGRIRVANTDNSRFHPGTANFTAAFWYKPYFEEDVPEAGDVILARGALLPADHGGSAGQSWNAGWNLRLNADRTVTLRVFEDSGKTDDQVKTVTSTSTLSDTDEWEHLAFTREGTAMVLYINGAAEGSVELSQGVNVAVAATTYGRELDTRDMRAGEMLDELAFWNRALTASEMAQLAAGTDSLQAFLDTEKTTLTRTVGTALENWSAAAWSEPGSSEVGPWLDGTSVAEISFTQPGAALTLDQAVTLEELTVAAAEDDVAFIGSKSLIFNPFGILDTTGVAAGAVARFSVPVSTGALDLYAHGSAATAASGRVVLEAFDSEELNVKSGLLELPESHAARVVLHESGLVALGEQTYAGAIRSFGNAGIRADAKLTLTETLDGDGSLTKYGSGELEISGPVTLAGNLTAVEGTLTLSGTPVKYVGGSLSVRPATLQIEEGADIRVNRLVTSDANGAASRIEQTGGSLTVTGNNNATGNTASFLLGHWSALTTYNLSGGSVTSPTAKIMVGLDGRVEWTIANATVTAPGFYTKPAGTHASVVTLNDGARMTLGSAGIQLNTNTTFTLNSGSTLGFSANAANATPILLGSGEAETPATFNPGGNRVQLPAFNGSGALTIPAQASPGAVVLTGAATGASALTVGSRATLVMGTGQALGAGSVVLDRDAVMHVPGLTMEQIGGANADNWKTLSGGAVSGVGDFSLIHTPGDSVPNNTVTVYNGRFYVPSGDAGKTWYFAGQYDDNIMLTIDGSEVFASATWNAVGSGSVAALTEGWHDFSVRARESGGADGPFLADWQSAVMAVGYRVGSAPANVALASAYLRFGPENLQMEGDGTVTLGCMVSGGTLRGNDVTLTRWHVHLGADEASTRITAFEGRELPNLNGATVSFTSDVALVSGGYTLGRFRNPESAVFTGLPAGLKVKIEPDGTVRVGRSGLMITLY